MESASSRDWEKQSFDIVHRDKYLILPKQIDCQQSCWEENLSVCCYVHTLIQIQTRPQLTRQMMFSLIVFLTLFPGRQASQSCIRIGYPGTAFFPTDESIVLLSTFLLRSYQACHYACHKTELCRVFDYDSLSQQCRLFEGDLQTTGVIGPSNSSTSSASYVEQMPSLFSAYGQPCSACSQSRYLRCINATCSCKEHTYWTGSICASQSLYAGSCTADNQCRSDLNQTCLQFFQCGPASLEIGTTIFGNANGSSGSSNTALYWPWGITVAPDESIVIADSANGRIILTRQDSRTPTAIKGTGQLNGPSNAMYDANMTNLYVLDAGSGRMMRFTNGSPNGTALFGSVGSGLNQFRSPHNFVIDSRGHFYIADSANHRVLFWPMGASSGIIVAGTTNAPGNGSFSLNLPTNVALDEAQGFMYIADHDNHRVLRFKLNSTNGTVVAGGNGPGVGRHQLNGPLGIVLFKKANALYISDQNNKRIQRWYLGDNQGVTIAGSPTGLSGTTPIALSILNNIALNANGTRIFVSDRNNNRIQMFHLI